MRNDSLGISDNGVQRDYAIEYANPRQTMLAKRKTTVPGGVVVG